jgi:hypothetical protein
MRLSMDWRGENACPQRALVWWAKRSVPTIPAARRRGGGHGASAPLPTIQQLSWRWAVIGEVDLEHAGIELLGCVEIVDRDRGVVALRVGDGPLLQLAAAPLSRPFGAGFGTGTFCADDAAVTIAAVTRSTPATRALRAAMVAANRMSGCLINASSCMARRLLA